jgi:hypothetical protein
MKSLEHIKDKIELIRQDMATHEMSMTAIDMLQKGAQINGLLWVIDDLLYPINDKVVTLSELPLIEQVIDSVHKE